MSQQLYYVNKKTLFILRNKSYMRFHLLRLFPPLISFARLAVGNFFFPEDDTDLDKAWAVYHNKLEHFQTDLCCLGTVFLPQLWAFFLLLP